MEFFAVSAHGIVPSKRAFHSCSVVGNFMYIFGGIALDRTVLNDMYMYNISSNMWSRIEDRVPGSSQSRP